MSYLIGRQRENFFQWLTSTGVPSVDLAEIDAKQNYSVTPGTRFIEAQPDEPVMITQFRAILRDNTNHLPQNGYGSGAGVLTNGISFGVVRGAAFNDLTGNLAITQNFRWALHMDVVEKELVDESASNLLVCQLNFGGSRPPIHLAPGDRFEVRLNDDFSSLFTLTSDMHRWGVFGYTAAKG